MRSIARGFPIFMVAASVCGLTACAGHTAIGARDSDVGRSRLAFAARLNIAHFSFDDGVDQIYGREMARLQQLCNTENHECLSKNFKPISRRVAAVYAAPDPSSPVIGHINAVLKLHPGYILTVGLDFEEARERGNRVTWMETVGDWHYAIRVPGVRVHGDWIQPVGDSFPAEGWLFTNTPSFRPFVEAIVGDILVLPELPAILPNGLTRPIQPGAYVIEKLVNGVVTFRAEVPSDMACDEDEDVRPPISMPPSLRADAREFFDAQGRALFSDAYSKGC